MNETCTITRMDPYIWKGRASVGGGKAHVYILPASQNAMIISMLIGGSTLRLCKLRPYGSGVAGEWSRRDETLEWMAAACEVSGILAKSC